MPCNRILSVMVVIAAGAMSYAALGQTVGDLTDTTAEGQVLKAAAERAEASYKLAHGKTVAEQADDQAKQASASHPVMVMPASTPLPPPPPPPPSMSGPSSVPPVVK
ncbi:hypothetical protein [Dyella ginsengisoli]|uniref:hypothetical protein n=1 Tax=Dyella ginsengisoli TaxID=363848 RepID=UPI00036DB107|nr:hypothetical protein [Dyella ginsengisoli]